MLMEAQGAEEKDKWRFSVYDFINEAQGVEEKDKWRFSVNTQPHRDRHNCSNK